MGLQGFVGSGAAISGRRTQAPRRCGTSAASVACCASVGDDRTWVSRRELLALVGAAVGGGVAGEVSAEPVTGRSVVNGVLSAYGLPQLPDASGFTPVLEKYGEDKIVEFLYPSAWLVTKEQSGIDRPRLDVNRINPTVTFGDYRKAETLAFYSTPANGVATFDVTTTRISEIIIPLPSADSVVTKDIKLDASGYRLTTFKFETNTTSGFNAQRRGLAVSTVVDDTLFVLGGTCNELRWKKTQPLFLTSMENFRVTKLPSK